jgi:hypothetical protein
MANARRAPTPGTAAIMGSLLQLLQRIDVEIVVNAGCQLGPDAWNSLKQLFRVRTFPTADRADSSGLWVTISTSDARPMPGNSITPLKPSLWTISSMGFSSSRSVLAARRLLVLDLENIGHLPRLVGQQYIAWVIRWPL